MRETFDFEVRGDFEDDIREDIREEVPPVSSPPRPFDNENDDVPF